MPLFSSPFFWILAVPFLWVNLAIVYTDFREKRIPNQYLVFLLAGLPFFYALLWSKGYSGLQVLPLISFGVIAFIVSFALYSWGVWSAGDAKYLLVLSWYLPGVGIIPLAGNIGLLTIAYLLGYCVYFYGKMILSPISARSLFIALSQEWKDKIRLTLQKHGAGEKEKKHVFTSLSRHFLLFLIVFISIRLLRMDFLEWMNAIPFFHAYLSQWGSYFVFGSGVSLFLMVYMYRRVISLLLGPVKTWLKKHIGKKFVSFFRFIDARWYSGILVAFLFGIIAWDYSRHGNEVFHKIFLILTTYFSLYLFYRLLLIAYHATFQLGEQEIIDITDLKRGDIIDKNYLLKLFWEQHALGFKQEKGLLGPDPKIGISQIKNPLQEEGLELVRQIYTLTNQYHQQKNQNHSPLTKITRLKTFAFGGYIFLGFLATFTTGDLPFSWILNLIQKYILYYGWVQN